MKDYNPLKIGRGISVAISFALTGILAALLIVCAVFVVPELVARTMLIYGIEKTAHMPLMAAVYMLIMIALAATAALMLLLLRVLRGRVFTQGSIFCLRCLSWLCMAALLPLCAAAYWAPIVLVIAFAVLLVGVILRVVKNVIEEATRIKEENELTI